MAIGFKSNALYRDEELTGMARLNVTADDLRRARESGLLDFLTIKEEPCSFGWQILEWLESRGKEGTTGD
jgi:hypothetical protein